MSPDFLIRTGMTAKRREFACLFFDRVVLRFPRAVILCVLAATILFALQARRFRLDASADTLVLENDEDLRYARLVNARYGQQDLLVLTYTPHGDLFAPQSLDALATLRDDLASLERVSSVLTILDVPLLQSPPVRLIDLAGELPTLQSERADKDLARKELSTGVAYRDLLLSADARTSGVLVTLANDTVLADLVRRRDHLRQAESAGTLTATQRTQRRLVEGQLQRHRDAARQRRHDDIVAIRAIMDRYRGNADLFLGGVSMIADDMITFIKNDLKVFGIGVVLFLAGMLGVIFRRIRWVTLPLLCCLVSVIIMVGLLAWFGWEVTVVSANFISLQLIMTMSVIIHLIVRYRELLADNPQTPNRRLILETVCSKLRPCLFATLTTIAGFGSLVFCDVLPVIAFGWMMIGGLIVSLIVTFLLFPSVLILLPKETVPRIREGRFSVTSSLARFTDANGLLIVALSCLALLASLIGISMLDVENCFIDYFHKSTEIHQGMKIIDRKLGGTTPLDVIVDFGETQVASAGTQPSGQKNDGAAGEFDEFDEFDDLETSATDDKYWFTAEKMARIKAVHKYLDGLPETGKVLSLSTLLSAVEQLKAGVPLDSFELALLFSQTPQEFKKILIDPYVSVKHNQARFWVRVRDSEKTLRRDALLKKIRTGLTSELNLNPKYVHLAGMLVLYNNMLQSLFGSQIRTLGITVLLLAGMFFVLFRSWRIAVIAMLGNVLSVALVLGVMGWLGIPLDMMTMTIAAISVGIAVDDTIHYIHRFSHEFQTDRRYRPTLFRCHASIGHAMYYTSVTIIAGFSILAASNFIPSVCFGLLTGLAMLVALLANLTLLPQMIILVKPFGPEQEEDHTPSTGTTA